MKKRVTAETEQESENSITEEKRQSCWCFPDHQIICRITTAKTELKCNSFTTLLPVLAGIQPAELSRLGVTLSLANRAIHDPDHVLHGVLAGQQDAHQERLRLRRPLVPAAWKLLDSWCELDIRVKQ